MIKYIVIIFLSLIFLIKIIGKLLDYEAERVINQLYERDDEGIIKGCKPIVHRNNNENAILFIHGYEGDPSWSENIIKKINQKDNNLDIYSPLLPLHGKNLETMLGLKNHTVEKFLLNQIEYFLNQYEKLTIVARSYGGASLIKIYDKIKHKNKLKIILYSPAIFIKKNNLKGKIHLWLLRLWRNYYNYKKLNLSVDPISISCDRKLRYFVIPAAQEVYKQDKAARKKLSTIQSKIILFIAKDDNYINSKILVNKLSIFKNFKIYLFPKCGHHIHRCKEYEDRFVEFLIEMNKNKESKAFREYEIPK